MTAIATRTLICDLIAAIAPEADTAALPDRADMRRALDLDSIDFTNLVIAIHERTGIDIPEADYHLLFTMAGAVDYRTLRRGQRLNVVDRLWHSQSPHNLARAIRMTNIKALPWLAATLAFGGCVVPPPQGPSVLAMPGEGKNYPQFQQDDAYCRQTASWSIGGRSSA